MLAKLLHVLIVALTMLANPSWAQVADKVDRLGVAGPLTFKNQSYSLAWSSKPSDTYTKQEYVPEGQSVESFRDMILVEALAGSSTPADLARAQVDMLERKSFDYIVNYAIFINDKTGEIVLDFVLSDYQADPVVLEWNAYRYFPLKDNKGSALYGISRRAYGEADTKAMLSGLKKIRDDNLNPFVASKAPVITIKD